MHKILIYLFGKTTEGVVDRESFWTFVAALVTIIGFILIRKQLQLSKEANLAVIFPSIIATRLSKEGEIGIFAGNEGQIMDIHIMNVGPGHAHKVHARIQPPARAYAITPGGIIEEGAIHVLHGLEMPSNSKRMWDNQGAFCNPWRYMYAEYEDIKGNEYYTIQSGYHTKTGRISELEKKSRKSNDDILWRNIENNNWLNNIDTKLKEWAEEKRIEYQTQHH